MTPQRIQRKRSNGWKMPEGAIYVGRPTRWGNPYKVVPVHRSGSFDVVVNDHFVGQSTGLESAQRMAINHFITAIRLGYGFVPWPREIRNELAGHDLVCWCPLDQPCHADVLLEIANRP